MHDAAWDAIHDTVESTVEYIERLEVCGTCKHYRTEDDAPDYCTADKAGWFNVWRTEACHFTPSRWRPYWDGESDG